MKITSWNVNSIRARIDNLKNYLKLNSPDIVLLQEIKTLEENYPYEEIKKSGYLSYVKGQKSYNGVSILSKEKIAILNSDLPGDKIKQSRFLSSEIKVKNKKINLINIYVPNGNPVDTKKYHYKLKWLDLLILHIDKKLKENNKIIISGDFNIIPDEIDVYNHNKYVNDALFRLEVRKRFRKLINLGFNDAFRNFNNKPNYYTFWDYMNGSWAKNNGMRIDHFLVSNSVIDLVKKVEIKKNIRNQTKPSDHVPIECLLG